MSNLQHKGVKGMKWRPKHLRNKPPIKNTGEAVGVGLGNIKALQNKEARNRRGVQAGRIRGGQVALLKLARSKYRTDNLKETFSKPAKQAANGVKKKKKKKEKTYKIRKIGIPALLFRPSGKKRG